MRTIIRLQRQGTKDKFYYNIVLMGCQKRVQARPVELLGYWFPRSVNEHGKSVVLNKTRLRYWLSTGAQMGKKVQRFLSDVGMSNAPWISWGRSTLYKEKGRAEDVVLEEFDNQFEEFRELDREHKDYEEMRKEELIKPLLRKAKYLEQIRDYFDQSKIDESIERVMDAGLDRQEDTSFMNTHKFYILKELYDTVESKSPLMSRLKRESLYMRMNELAEKGLLEEKSYRNQKERVERDVREMLEGKFKDIYSRHKNDLREKLEEFERILSPISVEDFTMQVRQRSTQSADVLEEKLKEFLDDVKVKRKVLSQADVEYFLTMEGGEIAEEDLENEEDKVLELSDKVISPSTLPLTPFPNFNNYDPKEWFDLREERGDQIRNRLDPKDEWFNTPLSDEKANKRELDHDQYWDGLFSFKDEVKEIPLMTRTKFYLNKQKRRREGKEKKEDS